MLDRFSGKNLIAMRVLILTLFMCALFVRRLFAGIREKRKF